MQTLFNVLALSSFIVSTATVVGGVYIYTNKDVLIHGALGGITGGVMDDWVHSPHGMIPEPLEEVTGGSQVLPVLPYNPFKK